MYMYLSLYIYMYIYIVVSTSGIFWAFASLGPKYTRSARVF